MAAMQTGLHKLEAINNIDKQIIYPWIKALISVGSKRLSLL